MKLYTYFRSSAAYRVRIALNLKGLAYQAIPVHLLRDGGQQKQAGYRQLSPLGLIPALQTETGVFTQSLSIMEWLDESYPDQPLLPADTDSRARVRAIAQTIACDIHPINNLRVLNYLTSNFGISEEQKSDWYRHWINEGLAAIEKLLADDPRTGVFCHGDIPGIADCCLIPQVFNAHRFNCPMENLPTIRRIVAACGSLEAFQHAAPDRQPDFE